MGQMTFNDQELIRERNTNINQKIGVKQSRWLKSSCLVDLYAANKSNRLDFAIRKCIKWLRIKKKYIYAKTESARANYCASNMPQYRYRYSWLILIQCHLCRSSSDLEMCNHLPYRLCTCVYSWSSTYTSVHTKYMCLNRNFQYSVYITVTTRHIARMTNDTVQENLVQLHQRLFYLLVHPYTMVTLIVRVYVCAFVRL